jgi:hypothetical protein
MQEQINDELKHKNPGLGYGLIAGIMMFVILQTIRNYF